MESTQAGKNTPAQPSTIPTFGRIPRCMYFHLRLHSVSRHRSCLIPRQAYVREISAQLVIESISEAGEQTPSACQYDIAHENLTQIRVTSTERFADQLWYTFWKVRIGCLQGGTYKV
jgi:hypothetical protein